MSIISSSMLHRSAKTTLHTNGLRKSTSPPSSSIAQKSNLRLTPQQLRIIVNNNANIMLQRKSAATISLSKSSSSASTRKQLRTITNNNANIMPQRNSAATTSSAKSSPSASASTPQQLRIINKKNANIMLQRESDATTSSSSASPSGILNSNGILSVGTITIEPAPGIGGLTNSNNKLKQQSTTKKTSSGAQTANGATIVLESERVPSPLHSMATLNGSTSVHGNQMSAKILVRNVKRRNVAPANHMHSNSPSSSIESPPLVGKPIIKIKPLNKLKAPVEYPKPTYTYACLVALALKNSRSGMLTANEIHNFICEHFPYFKTVRSKWKKCIGHSLSLKKCFDRVEKTVRIGGEWKSCLWAINPHEFAKMDEEIQNWARKDPMNIRAKALLNPENLEALERGELKHGGLIDDLSQWTDIQSKVKDTADLEKLDQVLDDTNVDSHEMYVEEDDDSGLQPHSDFDAEVEDGYDIIEIEDNKDALRLSMSASDIIEITSSPSPTTDTDYQSPKRARLSVN